MPARPGQRIDTSQSEVPIIFNEFSVSFQVNFHHSLDYPDGQGTRAGESLY